MVATTLPSCVETTLARRPIMLIAQLTNTRSGSANKSRPSCRIVSARSLNRCSNQPPSLASHSLAARLTCEPPTTPNSTTARADITLDEIERIVIHHLSVRCACGI